MNFRNRQQYLEHDRVPLIELRADDVHEPKGPLIYDDHARVRTLSR